MADINAIEYYLLCPRQDMSSGLVCAEYCRVTFRENGAELIDYDPEIDDSDSFLPLSRCYQVPEAEGAALLAAFRLAEKGSRRKTVPGDLNTPISALSYLPADGPWTTVPAPSEEFITLLLTLKDRCGLPVRKVRGPIISPFGVSMPPEASGIDSDRESPSSEEGWDCPVCGEKRILRKFCPMCGTARP